MHEGGGRWVGSNKMVELKTKNRERERRLGELTNLKPLLAVQEEAQ